MIPQQTATQVKLLLGAGMNTSPNEMNIKPGQTPACKNVHTNLTSSLQRRLGNTLISTAGTGTAGNGMFDYWKDSAIHFLVSYISTNLYKMDYTAGGELDGTLDPLAFTTTPTDTHMSFEQFNEAGTTYLIMSTKNRDVIQKWDGVSSSTTDLSSDVDTPRPKFVKTWMGFLMCANVNGYESRTYYNNVSNAVAGDDAWNAVDYQDIQTKDGGGITGQAILNGRFYTFKKNSIHRWTYYGGSPLFGVKEVVTGVGTLSPDTIMNINHPQFGNILTFLGTDNRFYRFDGTSAVSISNDIEGVNGLAEFSLARINGDYSDLSHCVDYTDMHWLVCWLPSTSYCNWCFIWDYYSNTWWLFDNIDAWCSAKIRSGGSDNIYWVGDTGKVYQFNSGNTDAGIAVNAYYLFAKLLLDNFPILKKQRYVALQLNNVPGASVSFKFKSDWSNTWSESEALPLDAGGFILGSGILGVTALGGPNGINHTVDIPTISHAEQFRISSNETNAPWHLYNANVVIEGLGYGDQ